MSSSIERYPYAFKTSQKILNACQCSFYPLDIERIILSCSTIQAIIMSESTYQEFRLQTSENRPYIKIKDGRTYYDPNRNIYIIIYNDSKPKNRVRFTLAHEFAHIIFGHLSDKRTEIDRGGLPDSVYFAYEGAANVFAGNFLAPPIIIHEKIKGKPFTSKSVASMFGISERAVREYRADDYNHWISLVHMPEELSILTRYRNRLHTSKCTKCGFICAIKGSRHCPICGSLVSPLRAEDDEAMGKIYPGIKLDETGRCEECPRCKNDEHLKGANFCMICGQSAVNQCADAISYAGHCPHNDPLPGNARYCPYCGAKTTFFLNGSLTSWNGESDNDSELPY